MNEELTREVLEAMKKCKQDCPSCGAIEVCSKYGWQEMIQALAAALLEERAKPKVWDSIHTTVDKARIIYYAGDKCLYDKEYTRELPKTRARQIAENIVRGINDEIHSDPKDIEYVEGVLKRYAEELKGEA